MSKHFKDWTLDELKALPERPWNRPETYDSLLLFTSGNLHESGWSMICIAGIKNGEPVELATQSSDDLEWDCSSAKTHNGYHIPPFRTDCAPGSGAMHVWSNHNKFTVAEALSSITIAVLDKKL